MGDNMIRLIFSEVKHAIYCDVDLEYSTGSDDPNALVPTGYQVVSRHEVPVELKVQYLPCDGAGVVRIEFPDGPPPYDDMAWVAAGFQREIVHGPIETEAELIRAAILYFDHFIEHLNRLSPYDETEVGRFPLPSLVRTQAA